MSEHARINRPPDDCPNGGVCATMLPRLENVEEQDERHSAALERIGGAMDQLQKEVHEIRVTLRERDKLGGFLQTAFMSILGVLIIQIVTGIWWASTITGQMQAASSAIIDHELRLREHSKYINARQ
jgi:ferric-dicitrate binding protein FerR (iron transport regulator)